MDVAEIIKEFFSEVGLIDLIFVPGVILLGVWLLRTGCGRRSLSDSAAREHNMPAYIPFVVFFIWFSFFSVGLFLVTFLPDVEDWQEVIFQNAALCISAMAGVGVTVLAVRRYFVRGLRGFGLDLRTALKDLGWGFVNLLSVWPLVMLAIVLVILLGKFFYGAGYEMQKHEELELIAQYPQVSVRVVILLTTVFIVPVFEEFLFRGLFQTTVRSLLENWQSRLKGGKGAWAAIAISSALFATVHSTAAHWPALFVLSMCMGYAYEKSGSLLRSIAVHSLFNLGSVLATLYQ
jgi:membrane protease YdiL (CAAX protease family)